MEAGRKDMNELTGVEEAPTKVQEQLLPLPGSVQAGVLGEGEGLGDQDEIVGDRGERNNGSRGDLSAKGGDRSRHASGCSSIGEKQNGGLTAEMVFQLEMKRIEIEEEERRERLELEKRRFAMEEEERQRRLVIEEEERQRKLVLEERKLELEREALERREARESRRVERESDLEMERVRRGLSQPRDRPGDVERMMAHSLKLIPDFDESRVNEWFVWFELKAREFSWDRARWVSLVANKLTGKAMEAYSQMSADEVGSYEEFKADILRVYELRPEAYRLQFRGGKKRASESYKECAQYLARTFRKWTASENVQTLGDLEELMIMEQFIDAADKELAPKLREKRFKTVKEAAVWADDYVLAYRSAPTAGFKYRGDGGPRGPGSGGSAPHGPSGAPRRSSYGGYANRQGAGTPRAPTPSSSAKTGAAGRAASSTPRYDNRPTCYNCQGKGHFRSNCPKLSTITAPHSPQEASGLTCVA